MKNQRHEETIHRVKFYAILFDGFLAPTKLADYPLVDHVEYRLRRAWPRGVVRRYVGEIRLKGIGDLALEELLRLLDSGPTVVEQLHVFGYSIGTANAIHFCNRLAELPMQCPAKHHIYRLHPGILPHFLGRTDVVHSRAWRTNPLTSLTLIDCNAHSRTALDIRAADTPVVNMPIQHVLHLRSIHGPRRGVLDGRGLPVEFPNSQEVKNRYFGGHHGMFPLEGGRPAFSMDDEGPIADTREGAHEHAGAVAPSQCVFDFVEQAVRQPCSPVLLAGNAPHAGEEGTRHSSSCS